MSREKGGNLKGKRRKRERKKVNRVNKKGWNGKAGGKKLMKERRKEDI